MADLLLRAYKHQLATIRGNLTDRVTQTWDDLGYYDGSAVNPFTGQVLPLVAAGQEATARSTAGYIAQRFARKPAPLDIAELIGESVRRGGTSDAAAYEGPFVAVWSMLSNGAAPADAISYGLSNLVTQVVSDLQDTTWAATDQSIQPEDGVIGYVSTPSGGNVCGFCVTQASRFLKTDFGDEPWHDHCSCTLEPVTSIAQADQLRQPYLNAYREDVRPFLSEADKNLGTPEGKTDANDRSLSRMKSLRFQTGDDGSLTLID